MKKIHMIGNAHIDPVWLWRWQEGFQEVRATFQSALDRMDEFGDFVFTSSSAQYYSWIEENAPEMFEKIRQRVAQGRWVLCGGWWVQPDCNIPSGESFARQSLLTQNYFRDKFGVTSKVGYNVDSFGHNGMLPQILKKSGMDAYVFMRPMQHEKKLPGHTFRWESDDGSHVIAFRIPYAYGTFHNLREHVKKCAGELQGPSDEIMCFYGVGNHGGGPTVENLETIGKLKSEYQKAGISLVLSDPNRFFESAAKRAASLPVVHSELQHHASGCYSVESAIKKLNRKTENALLSAEKFSCVSAMAGRGCYVSGFHTAWKDLLFNQFHDILAGTCIREAYFDARNAMGEALAIASRNQNNALQALSAGINLPKEENVYPVVVFNPHSWESEAEIEVENNFSAFSGDCETITVTGPDGAPVPSQKIGAVACVSGRTRIAFTAKVPALGYALYKIRGTHGNESRAPAKGTGNSIENEAIRITADPASGGMSVYDKRAEMELFSGPAALPVVMEDPSDTWSHDVFRFDKVCGKFDMESVQRIAEGNVKNSLRVIGKYRGSTITQIFTLYSGKSEIYADVKVDWQEQFRCLKLEFPVAVDRPAATYEIPFGNAVREPNGDEEPMQNWLDVTGAGKHGGETCGVGILNDCKYSADVSRSVIRLTVLRSPAYAFHHPYRLSDDPAQYDYIDQGIQTFRYVVVPHRGSWREAGLVRKGIELNQPMPHVVESFHGGALPACGSFLRVSPPNIVLSALKKAEKSDAYILRLYETDGARTAAQISLPALSRTFGVDFGPYEIKTLLIPAERGLPVRETDFNEF